MISNPPSSSSQFNFAVFASVIHHFRDQVFVCQRAARAYIACRHARFEALKHWWVEEEKIWINGMKLKRRTTEHENSAVDNHAPQGKAHMDVCQQRDEDSSPSPVRV